MIGDDVLAECMIDLEFYSSIFLPERFNTAFAPAHKQLCKFLDSPSRKKVIKAPRGIGKTSFVRAVCERAICYRTDPFILYGSSTETHGMMQTENIKMELQSNAVIRAEFGVPEVRSSNDATTEKFSQSAWVAYGSTLIMPRGLMQQWRGLVYKNKRPSLIVMDDLEDKDSLISVEYRNKVKERFHSDIMKCIDQYSGDYRIIYIDTLKHHDSLLQDLLDDPSWDNLELDICDDNLNSYIPTLMSTEEIKKEYENHKRRGMIHVFNMEYRGMPSGGEDQKFKPEHFKQYDPAQIDFSKMESYILCDPTRTVNEASCHSAVVGFSFDPNAGAIYIRDIDSGLFTTDELYNRIFDMAFRIKASVVGIETTGLEEFIKQPIRNLLSTRQPRFAFEPVWLKARGGSNGEKGKIKRISALAPLYRMGYIYHNPQCCSGLEQQLLSFPRGKLQDIADATAYLVELLELGERYMEPEDNMELEMEPVDREIHDETLNHESYLVF